MKDRQLTVSYMHSGTGKPYVPGFRIAGKWLKNLGYNFGDVCRISINEDGSLNIVKVSK